MNQDKRGISEFFPLINTFLRRIRDIHHDDHLLEHCYVNVFARQFDTNAVASYSFNLPAVSFTPSNEKFLEKVMEKSEIFSQHECLDPILVYAHVGHGKTTYIRHLFKVRADKDPTLAQFRRRVYSIYLEYTLTDPKGDSLEYDFTQELHRTVSRALSDNGLVLDYNVLKAIFPSLVEEYEIRNPGKAISKEALHAFIISSCKTKLIYLRAIVRWLRNTHRIKIVCVLDNVDRHLSQFDSEQRVAEMFQTISSCFLQVILPLRISNRGFQYNDLFTALSPIPITLGIPDYAQVIRSRINYIRQHMTNDLGSPMWKNDDDSITTTTDLFKALDKVCALLEKNAAVKHSMAMLSNYVTREYLDIMINLLSSETLWRHPLSGKPIDYGDKASRGKVFSMFVYSLMLRNNAQLREDDKGIPILHMFNNQTATAWTTFVRWYLLNYLSGREEHITSVGKLLSDMETTLGVGQQCTSRALLATCRKGCVAIDTVRHLEPEKIEHALMEMDSRVMLAPRGQFHLELSKELEYYEVLAIPRLIRTKLDSREIVQTTMAERRQNVTAYLDELAGVERVLLRDDERCLWTKRIQPLLLREIDDVFGETPNKAL